MVKSEETVIEYVYHILAATRRKLTISSEFNELVNMSAAELEKWLKSGSSEDSGWSKDDGSGETIGHERYVSGVHDGTQLRPNICQWSQDCRDSQEEPEQGSRQV